MGPPPTWLSLFPILGCSAPSLSPCPGYSCLLCSRWQEWLRGPIWRQVYIPMSPAPGDQDLQALRLGKTRGLQLWGTQQEGIGLGDLSSLRTESHWIMHLQCLSPQSTGVWESSLGQGSMACDQTSRAPAGNCAAGRGVSKVCWGPLENTHPPPA